jgi:hypothetical protein
MRLCPKCRTYFDDSLLRFCTNDGMPLVSIDQSSELWQEGSDFIRETNHQIQREIRRTLIKKVISILITTVVITSIISVITLQSWIYSYPEEAAKIRGEKTPQPLATPEITVVATPEFDRSPTPENAVNTESTPVLPTPIIKKTPKTDTPINSPDVKITPIPTVAKTPEQLPADKPKVVTINKNTNLKVSPTPTVNVCMASDQQRYAEEIKRSYSSFWKQKIMSQESRLFEKYLKDQKFRQGAQLSVYQAGITVNVDAKCETATATVPIAWTVYSTKQAFLSETKTVNGSESFTCRRGKIWSCL